MSDVSVDRIIEKIRVAKDALRLSVIWSLVKTLTFSADDRSSIKAAITRRLRELEEKR